MPSPLQILTIIRSIAVSLVTLIALLLGVLTFARVIVVMLERIVDSPGLFPSPSSVLIIVGIFGLLIAACGGYFLSKKKQLRYLLVMSLLLNFFVAVFVVTYILTPFFDFPAAKIGTNRMCAWIIKSYQADNAKYQKPPANWPVFLQYCADAKVLFSQ